MSNRNNNNISCNLSSYTELVKSGRAKAHLPLILIGALTLSACSATGPQKMIVTEKTSTSCMDQRITEIYGNQTVTHKETIKSESGEEEVKETEESVEKLTKAVTQNLRFNQQCARLQILSITASAVDDQSTIGVISAMALLKMIADSDPDIKAAIQSSLKEHNATIGDLEKRRTDFYKRYARKELNASVARLYNANGTVNVNDASYILEAWDGEKTQPGGQFEYLTREQIRSEVDRALKRAKKPTSIQLLQKQFDKSTPYQNWGCVQENGGEWLCGQQSLLDHSIKGIFEEQQQPRYAMNVTVEYADLYPDLNAAAA